MFNLTVAVLLGYKFDRHGWTYPESDRHFKVYDDEDYSILNFSKDITRITDFLEKKFGFTLEFSRQLDGYNLLLVHGREGTTPNIQDSDLTEFLKKCILAVLQSEELELKLQELKNEYPYHYERLKALN